MKDSKDIQETTGSQVCYYEEMKARELETIRSNDGFLEAQVI